MRRSLGTSATGRWSCSSSPPHIPADQFAQILTRVSDPEERKLLKEWYPRDNNAVLKRGEDRSRAEEPGWEWMDTSAVLPEHYLKPREGQYKSRDKWGPVERRLHSILVAAVKGTALEDDPRYGASATEQEIVRALSAKLT